MVFEAGRFGEDSDYLNCPMNQEEYRTFLEALRAADVHQGHDFDSVPYFEGCLPVEVMASRGDDTLRFGPMKPIGLEDPRTGPTAPSPWSSSGGRTGRARCGTWWGSKPA